jgi:hypothetical protein
MEIEREKVGYFEGIEKIYDNITIIHFAHGEFKSHHYIRALWSNNAIDNNYETSPFIVSVFRVYPKNQNPSYLSR